MADILTISIQCDDGVVRDIKINLGEVIDFSECYSVTVSKDFVEDVVNLYQSGKYTGVFSMKLGKE